MNIDAQDDYSLEHIFELLNLKDRTSCELTCKRWFALSARVNIQRLVIHFGVALDQSKQSNCTKIT